MRSYLILLLSILLSPIASTQVSIAGTAPSAYRNQLVHLDILDDHRDVVTIADYMLLAQASIDSGGHFTFTNLTLPEGPGLYRLRYRMGDEPPVSMNFLQRHFITCVLSDGDSLNVNGLTLLNPSPINQSLTTTERELDRYRKMQLVTSSDRRGEEANRLHHHYLRKKLHEPSTDPYTSVYALGAMDVEVTTTKDLLAADAALARTDLPRSFRSALDRELGAHAYQQLKTQNVRLKTALVVVVLSCLLLCYFMYRQSGSIPKESTPEVRDTPTELTDKEREVFELATTGSSNKEIAAALFVSVSTVKTHLNSIYRKLGVSSRRELLERGVETNSTPV